MHEKSDTSERMRARGKQLRAGERIEHRVSVAFSPEPLNPNSYMTPPPMRFGQLVNISQNGMCLDAPGRFHLFQVISLYLRLAEETSGITMLAKIIWLESQMDGKERLGLQFIGPLPADWQTMIPKAN